jgi:hypothetical protein
MKKRTCYHKYILAYEETLYYGYTGLNVKKGMAFYLYCENCGEMIRKEFSNESLPKN